MICVLTNFKIKICLRRETAKKLFLLFKVCGKEFEGRQKISPTARNEIYPKICSKVISYRQFFCPRGRKTSEFAVLAASEIFRVFDRFCPEMDIFCSLRGQEQHFCFSLISHLTLVQCIYEICLNEMRRMFWRKSRKIFFQCLIEIVRWSGGNIKSRKVKVVAKKHVFRRN